MDGETTEYRVQRKNPKHDSWHQVGDPYDETITAYTKATELAERTGRRFRIVRIRRAVIFEIQR